jgi:hypothetical protein
LPATQSYDDDKQSFETKEVLVTFVRLFLKNINRKDCITLLKTKAINGRTFIELAKNHKCCQIILHAIKVNKLGRHIPKLTNRLQIIVDKTSIHNSNLWNEYVSVSDMLDRENIEYVIYKGVPFAQQFYPSSSLRHSVDIDLGLSLEDIPKAARILFSAGYEDHKNKIDYSNITKSRAYQIDFSYVKRNSENQILYNIELHWQAAHHVLQLSYPFEDSIRNKVNLKIKDKDVPTLSKIELTVLMLIHHGMVDVWGKLRHLIDLHFVLETLNETEMTKLRTRLKELKLNRCFELGCQQLKILKQEHKQDEFWEQIMSGNLTKNWSEYRPKLKWHLKMRESYLERIKVLISLSMFKLRF